MSSRSRIFVLLMVVFILVVLASFLTLPLYGASSDAPSTSTASEDIWGKKPVLGVLMSDSGAWDALVQSLPFSDQDTETIREIVVAEEGSLRQLYTESQHVVEDSALSMDEKKARIEAMNFNGRVADVLQLSESRIREALGQKGLADFIHWIEERWAQARAEHGTPPQVIVDRDASGVGVASLTYRVYATQYDVTDWEVALPDKCLKFANLGWPPCPQPGYDRSDYSVTLQRGGATVSDVLIRDVGPWNIDDNYWSTGGAPIQPRRLFADLTQGMPESQAAFYNGYNNGLDQFGRNVTNPTAIDLSPQVAAALGLADLQNDWITVTYTWMAPPPPTPTPTPTRTATPTPTRTPTPTPCVPTPVGNSVSACTTYMGPATSRPGSLTPSASAEAAKRPAGATVGW